MVKDPLYDEYLRSKQEKKPVGNNELPEMTGDPLYDEYLKSKREEQPQTPKFAGEYTPLNPITGNVDPSKAYSGEWQQGSIPSESAKDFPVVAPSYNELNKQYGGNIPLAYKNTTPKPRFEINNPAPATGISKTLPSTVETAKEIFHNGLSLGHNSVEAANTAWDSVKEGVHSAANALVDAVYGKEPTTSAELHHKRTGEEITGAYLTAIGETMKAPLNVLSSFFTVANSIPVVGTISRIVTLPFEAVGDVSPEFVRKVINGSPLSDKWKKAITPGITTIVTMAAEIAAGAAIHAVGKMVKAKVIPSERRAVALKKSIIKDNPELSREIKATSNARIKSLFKDYGKEDVVTIVRESAKLAKKRLANMKEEKKLGVVDKQIEKNPDLARMAKESNNASEFVDRMVNEKGTRRGDINAQKVNDFFDRVNESRGKVEQQIQENPDLVKMAQDSFNTNDFIDKMAEKGGVTRDKIDIQGATDFFNKVNEAKRLGETTPKETPTVPVTPKRQIVVSKKKVVVAKPEEGETYYHGTSAKSYNKINEEGFKVTKPVHGEQVMGEGIYLTPTKGEAKSFGKKVVEVRLPKDIKIKEVNPGEHWKIMVRASEKYPSLTTSKAITKMLKEEGYDGIKMISAGKKGETYVTIFDPKKLSIARGVRTSALGKEKVFQASVTNINGRTLTGEANKLFLRGRELEKAGKVNEAWRVYDKSVKLGIEDIKKTFPPNGINPISLRTGLGRFDGETEPTIWAKFRVKPGYEEEFAYKMAKLADKGFGQKSVYITQDLKGIQKYGIIDKEKGISVEPSVTIRFNRKITPKDIEWLDKSLAKHNLAGATITPDYKGLMAYNVSVYSKDYEGFIKNIKAFVEDNEFRRIWNSFKKGSKRVRSIGNTRGEGLTTYRRIYGQFRSSLSESGKVSPKVEGGKVSGIAKSIEAKAIEKGLTKKFGELAEFRQTSIKEQAKMTADFINKDINEARMVIRGEKPLPKGVRGISLVDGMEQYLEKNPNVEMAYELANSPLVSGTSLSAQELSLARMRDPDSFTAKALDVKKARESKVRNLEKRKVSLKKSLKKEINKVNLPKAELSWDKFLDKISC